jgi:surface carbohydrate biosynthesis protein
MDRYLYLPIEVGSRELNSKSLIASVAAERGHTVVLGFQHDLVQAGASLPPGVFLSKGSNNTFLKYVPALRAAGHAVAVSEEENYGYRLTHSPVCYNSKELQDRCDLYLCIGPDEAAHIERRYGATFPKAVTGNARTDFLRPRLRAMYEPEVQRIKEEYGKFILLNSNFGLTNPISRTDLVNYYKLWVEIGCFDDNDHSKNKKIFESFVHWEQYNARLVRELLEQLAKRPDYKVLIRPHPAEWAEGWAQYLKTFASTNIKLIENSPHIPFMLASDLTIHPGCATGMEALALGVPALSLMGSSLSVNETSVANHVNVTASTTADALALIENHWRGGDLIRSQQDRLLIELDHYLAEISSDVLSAENIVSAMTQLLEQRGISAASRRLDAVEWKSTTYAQDPYFQNKYGVTEESLEHTLSSLRRTMNRFHAVTHRTLYSGIYLVSGPTAKQQASS